MNNELEFQHFIQLLECHVDTMRPELELEAERQHGTGNPESLLESFPLPIILRTVPRLCAQNMFVDSITE